MTKPAMVGEVNRLVASSLAANRALSLPGIGTLRPERRAAKRLSGRKLQPPFRVVEFSSREEGLPLPDAIVRAARCDAELAQTVYERWLTYVLADGVLTIEGVGTLRQKHFTLDPEFDRQLNPQGREPIRIRRPHRFDWVLWLGVAAILFVGGFWGYQFVRMRDAGQPDGVRATHAATSNDADSAGPVQQNELAAAETGVASTVGSDASSAPDGPQTDGSGPVAEPRAADADAAGDAGSRIASGEAQTETASESSDRLVPGRRYVVSGVFSTLQNAERAAAEAGKRVDGVHCAVLAFGAKWMVSPFASDDAAACTRFVNEYGDRFPGLWVYAAR